jgi:hypothetical protein
MPPKNPLQNLGTFAHPAKAKKPAKAMKPDAVNPSAVKPKKVSGPSMGKGFTRPNHENNFGRVTKSPFGA